MKNTDSRTHLPVMLVGTIDTGGLISFVNTLIALGYQMGAAAVRVVPSDAGDVGEIFYIPPPGNVWKTLIGYESQSYSAIVSRFKVLAKMSISVHNQRQCGEVQEFDLFPNIKVRYQIEIIIDDNNKEIVQVEYLYP